MNSLLFKRHILPHILVVLGFLVITFVYMQPVLEGQEAKQQDIKQWEGMTKQARDFEERTGENTWWTNSMFGGMPTYMMLGGHDYNMYMIGKVQKPLLKTVPKPANSLFLYLVGFYFMLITWGLTIPLSIIGALGFAFTSNNLIIVEAGHMTKSYAIGFAPLVMAGVILAIKRRKLILGGAITAMFLPQEIAVNHPQITYYLAMIIAVYLIFELVKAIRSQDLKFFSKACGVLLLSAIVSFGCNLSDLGPTYEYSKETIRGESDLSKEEEGGSGLSKDYAFRWSYGIAETGTILIPNFHGGSSMKSFLNDRESETFQTIRQLRNRDNIQQYAQQMTHYWGNQPFTSGPHYFGALVCFLFVLGLFLVKGPAKWWLLVVALLSIMLAWGKNFTLLTDLFFYYVPFYNKFRSVTMIMFIAQFAFPFLGILALKKLIDYQYSKEELKKALHYSFGIVGGLCLIFALVPGLFLDFASQQNEATLGNNVPELLNALKADRKELLQSDAWRSFIFIALGAGLLYLYAFGMLVNKKIVLIGTGALILIDLWAVDRRYLNAENFVEEQEETKDFSKSFADRQILKDKDPNYRVLNLTVSPFNDATTSYHHKSIGGYHGAKLGRYQELIDYQIQDEISYIQQNLRNRNFLQNRQTNEPVQRYIQPAKAKDLTILNMLDMRYLIVGSREREIPVKNPAAYGNAWFVRNLQKVANADEAIDKVGKIDPLNKAIYNKKFQDYVGDFQPDYDPNGSIELTNYKPNELKYKTKASSPQFAVFSEIYYNDHKGWQVYLDGEKVEHMQVNYVLRGMKVPAGEHTIRFDFDPPTYQRYEMISLASSLLSLLIIFSGLGYELRKVIKNPPKIEEKPQTKGSKQTSKQQKKRKK